MKINSISNKPYILVSPYCEHQFETGGRFEISCTYHIKPLPKEEPIVKTELTIQQIADKFGIEVDNLQIIK